MREDGAWHVNWGNNGPYGSVAPLSATSDPWTPFSRAARYIDVARSLDINAASCGTLLLS